ncbi:protein SAR DEFICIENT 4 [Beta vulgaris subsp. vulgaris]|uniref:protein SAR DEFICIENT 4 n=1 Tax=Beta vulgaris subsp. vulgaris TaxID=3555 RepID=UPI00203735A8|nr:protein SAR DEFICIENT 4 [Beta vulgaris subsp. vulgaris]
MATPSITSTTTPIFISTTTLRSILSHKTLISHLKSTLPNASLSLSTPPRHSLSTSQNSTLLLMPSFSTSPSLPYIGVKLVTSHPQNSSLNLPGIHACYTLFHSLSGQTLALFDATELTLFRTSSISGLGSLYLSNFDSHVLVMVGSGNLSPHLITAHLSVRPSIKRVIIWNRTAEKAAALADRLTREKGFEGVTFESNGCLEDVIGLGDIVSCATNSEHELVEGVKLKEGAHLDLVGSFKQTMKECDDEAIRRGRVFVDNEVALEEAGELVGAFERGVISKDDVCGTLVELIKGDKVGRKNDKEITVFKSVGSGVVDLLTAQLVYETVIRDQIGQC